MLTFHHGNWKATDETDIDYDLKIDNNPFTFVMVNSNINIRKVGINFDFSRW